MKTAVYQRPTSATQQHTVAITLGEGDIREVTVNEAQHLLEVLGMALQDYLDYINQESEK